MNQIMTAEGQSLDISKMRLILTSHSIDNVFDYCPRKFEFLNIHDKRPKRDSGFAAMVGTALHEATQAWLIARDEGKSESEATNIGFMTLLRFYPWDLEAEQATSTRSHQNTILMFYKIIRSAEWDEWELVKVKDRGWAVEIPFLIRHTSIGPVFIKSRGEYVILATQGKIDLIMRHRKTGRIRTVDIKTTIIDSRLVRSTYEFSGQQVGYSHVLHAMMDEPPDDFEVIYCICRFSASEPPEIQFIPFAKSQDQIDDYWMAKLDRLQRIKIYAENDWFPRTNGGCNSWGNECSCFDICHSRDANLIRQWFDSIETEDNTGYDYWVDMEV